MNLPAKPCTSTRPIFHFTPPANWMNDPNGTIIHDGYYHLFYQYNPTGDEWGNIHWGHARSRNLCDWQRLPLALAPSSELGETHCYSGCCVLDKNRVPRIFYTKVGGETQQWTAEGSHDLLKWTKGPSNPVLARGMPGFPDFDQGWRDPFVFQFEGRHFMILGAEVGNRAVVPLFESTDEKLLAWKFRSILFSAEKTEVPYAECPNFFPCGQKWVLILSPYRRPQYYLGTLNPGTMEFVAERNGPFDGSNNFYATNVFLSDGDEHTLVGWIRGFPKGMGWSGCLSLPRLVSSAGGVLRQEPHPALANLRTKVEEQRSNWEVTPDGACSAATAPNCEINLRTSTIGEGLGLLIRGAKSQKELLAIKISRDELTVGSESLQFSTPLSAFDISLFLDRSVVEIFISSEYALATVAPFDDRDVVVDIHSMSSPVMVESMTRWNLRAARFDDLPHATPSSGG